jgi:hypothetical protein
LRKWCWKKIRGWIIQILNLDFTAIEVDEFWVDKNLRGEDVSNKRV